MSLSAKDIGDVWKTVLSGVGENTNYNANSSTESFFFEAIQGVKNNGIVPSDLWKKLPDRFPQVEAAIEALEGPRESGVKAVEIAIQELSHGPLKTKKYARLLQDI